MGSERVAKRIATKILAENIGESRPSCAANTAQGLPDGVEKHIIKETTEAVEGVTWEKPTTCSEVTIHYVGTLDADGTVFDSSRSSNKPLTFTLGSGQVVKGLELGIATMKKGELAKFVISPDYGYGVEGLPPTVPPTSVLVFEVELLNWTKKEDLFGDQGVIKSVIAKGSGWKSPTAGDNVLISLKATARDGSILEEKPQLEYTLGSDALGSISKAVDKALLSTKKLEHVALDCSKDYSYGDKTPDGITIDLTLLELLETVDVSAMKDGTIVKKRIQEGSWMEQPMEESRVKLQVESVTDGWDSSIPGFCGPEMLEFTACNGEVCDALEFAVLEMKKGERAMVTCTQPALVCGPGLGLSDIDASKVVIIAELLDFEKGQDPWHLPEEDRYQYCTGCKDVGSNLFKQGRYTLALRRYNRVTELVGFMENISDDLKKKVNELRMQCELNKAACKLKIGDNSGAREACDAVLKEDKDNIKALFRRATALFNGSESVDALPDLKRILELEPANSEAKRLMQQVQRAQREADKGSKSMYANMCKGLGTWKTPDPRPLTAEEEFNQSLAGQSFNTDINNRAQMSSQDAFKDLFYKPGDEIRPAA